MDNEFFSQRYNLRLTPQGLIYNDFPLSAKSGFTYLLEKYIFQVETHTNLIKGACFQFRIPLTQAEELYSMELVLDSGKTLAKFVELCKWWQIFDFCELLYKHIKIKTKKVAFSKSLNNFFEEEFLGYEMRDGKIEKKGSGFVDANIKESRYLLKEPEFKGADTHFEKAMEALNMRPKPDTENCVKDAVSAIESVGRVITGDENILLDDVIKFASMKGIIPKPLDQMIQKLYAYRGNEPGVSHGATKIPKVTVEDAEFVLAVSAATIIYLVKKRNQFKP